MDGKEIEIVSNSGVYAVAFTDDSQVIGGDDKGDIRQWKVLDGQQHGPTMETGSGILCVVVSQDGRWIVSGDQGGRVIVWNTITHDNVLEFAEHGDEVAAVDISSDCTKIVSGGGGTTRVFSIAAGMRVLPPLTLRRIVGVKFSPDCSRLVTVSYDRGFYVYNAYNGDILFDSGVEGSSGAYQVTPLTWSSDSQYLFLGRIGKITCFHVANSSYSEWPIHQSQARVSIASNGRFIACSARSSVSLWDCVSHKQIGHVITQMAEINSIGLSPSGQYLTCGVGRNIIIHNLEGVLPPEYFDHNSRALRNAVMRRQLHASQLPLVQVNDEVLQSWTQDDPASTEKLLSKKITSSSNRDHYMLTIRALVRVRLKLLALAMDDVKESLQVQPSPMGYIAKAVVLLGEGDGAGALRTFDLAFHDCKLHDIRFLLLLKSIIVFESKNQEEAIMRVEDLATITDNNDDEITYLYNQVLGVMYMKKGNHGRGIHLINPNDVQCPPLQMISLIFGWSFNGPDIVTQQHLCESLYTEGRTAEAVDILLNIIRTIGEIQERSTIADWLTDFTKKCATALQHVGDGLTPYSATLSLSPPSHTSLLIWRSGVRAEKKLWEDALQDATDAERADPSYPWSYEAKHVAFHGAKRYDEAIDAFQSMLRAIEQSDDPKISQLRKNYISPSETIAAIDPIVREILKSCPLVVVDVTTGYLCDGPERMRIFKSSPLFKELVSAMTRKLDNDQIRQVVTSFLAYVMFSHAWQGDEPLYQDVKAAKSVWDLPDTPLSEKLRNFCKETRRLGHNWAWSDTCCIDKTTSSILNQSLTSMYKWYAGSAATLVFLAGVEHPTKPGDLTRSLWMTRAWTLQELLAPKVVFFYDSKWQPYLSDTGRNHKESPVITQELADAINIPRGTIGTFSPDDLGVREKLRLASTRNATVEEDVAYSLIGIFRSDIRPHYGEGADALGHLLEEIVARYGEVTVLTWSGKSSSYNSCLPASVSVYNQAPFSPPPLEEEDMESCIRELRSKLPQQVALGIYTQINFLPPARFATRRLHLPCIVFSFRKLVIQDSRAGKEKLYRARVSGLGKVDFTTTDDLPLHKPQKLVFAHPWIRHIRGPSDGVTYAESDTDSELDTDSNSDAGADDDASPSPSLAVSEPQVDDYTQALQMIARLGQPFSALLLLHQPNGEYKRVAAENEIVVSGLGIDITSKNIQVKVLEIL